MAISRDAHQLKVDYIVGEKTYIYNEDTTYIVEFESEVSCFEKINPPLTDH